MLGIGLLLAAFVVRVIRITMTGAVRQAYGRNMRIGVCG